LPSPAPAPPSTPPATVSFIRATLRQLDDHPSDLIILSAFVDERPFEGLAALVDFRLCGALSRWRVDGWSTGQAGERILFPSQHRLSAPRLILFGLGRRASFVPETAVALGTEAARVAYDLGAARLTTTLFGLENLTTPLERTAARLVTALSSGPGITNVALALSAAAEAATREALTLQWSQRD